MLFQTYFILHVVGEPSKEHILAVYYAIASSFNLYGVDPKDILYPCYSYSVQLPWITLRRCILSIARISLTSTGEVLFWYCSFPFILSWVLIVLIVWQKQEASKCKLLSFFGFHYRWDARSGKQPTLLVFVCLILLLQPFVKSNLQEVSYCSVKWGGLHRNLAMHLTSKS